MKYFTTKHEKDSAKITTLLVLIILLLIFVVGPKYMDPPEEYGVAINFGTTDFGSGNVQPTKPIKSKDLNINKPPETEPTEVSEPAKATQATEEVLTQETEEAVAIQKEKEAAKKAKAIADAKAKAEADRIAKEKKEQEEKKKKLDALIGGVSNSDGNETGSEGDDDKTGDKGQLNGDPYASSYFGDPGTGSGGVGYGLNGRGKPTKQVFKQDCNESGMVIVKIVVNRSGNVIEAEPGVKGSTNTVDCLLEPAKKIALSHKWKVDSKAPAKQIGFVKVNFNLGQ
ncbi:energy transducer TonB [Oceanihabitans sp. 2_MG-2023]|uniref:energy transducer TonB n=1 Tax=Oceanihabitans sp. 2_MG-2023 TaxID=3062661 RepID=UPI0026E34DFB|nr:energy transducer TonB [Oceanihabitans sp. 2_MG-2023]MDO6598254.1 energy transducer TonB [Oceanihabitans sp. 2_MG-2023]